MKRWLLVILTLCCRSTESFERERLVVWNIGQGSWATHVGTLSCDHFDAGGEGKIPDELTQLCFSRLNRIFVSHTDWDHISHVKDISRGWRGVCLVKRPRDLKLKSSRTRMMIERVPLCANKYRDKVKEISGAVELKRSNDLSRVFEFKKKWIFPGDSTATAEKVWSRSVDSSVGYLILGHHGSRTSTSEDLLSHLPNLRVAIASARFRKYGHPHSEIRERLRRHHIPLLITEQWGNLIFEL